MKLFWQLVEVQHLTKTLYVRVIFMFSLICHLSVCYRCRLMRIYFTACLQGLVFPPGNAKTVCASVSLFLSVVISLSQHGVCAHCCSCVAIQLPSTPGIHLSPFQKHKPQIS